MTTLARTLIALLIVVAANCGAGTDGKSVAPPTTPQVAPEPTPEAPGQPTGIRVVEVGQTFIVWAWDPVEGATGYQAEIFLAGLPPGQRGDPIITEEPTVRADDLEPRTEMEIYVRAVRETAGGRAVRGRRTAPSHKPSPNRSSAPTSGSLRGTSRGSSASGTGRRFGWT